LLKMFIVSFFPCVDGGLFIGMMNEVSYSSISLDNVIHYELQCKVFPQIVQIFLVGVLFFMKKRNETRDKL